MMNFANLVPVGIASLTVLAIALPNLKAQSPQPQQAVAQSPIAPQDGLTSPRRLTVKVSVAEPSDLKVKEGERLKKDNSSLYERQLVEYQQRLGEREFQAAQVKANLQEVDNGLPKALRNRPRPFDGS